MLRAKLALLQTVFVLIDVLDDIVTVLDEDQNNTGIGVMWAVINRELYMW